MPSEFAIAGRAIGPDHPPYVIAEVSANHNGRLDAAMKMIEVASQSGADAVKLQTYRPDTITLDSDAEEFRIRGGLWDGRTLYELYEEAHTPWEWHRPLFEHARKLGITIFSSPFDDTAVDLLESLDAPLYKIASFEAIDLPLIRRVAQTGKPMIISTGMASVVEIGEAVETAMGAGCTNLTLLKCTSSYPASPENTNLVTMPVIGKTFGTNFGLSDHTMGNGVAVAATALGGTVIEKHFILDRSEGGVDSAFSLEPEEFSALVTECTRAAQAMGEIWFGGTASEQAGRKKRRSLYIAEDLKAGDLL